MNLGLAGRIALVTGASRGIGRAVAEELAAEGAHVLICARGQDDLEAAAHDIRAKTSATVHAITADVSVPEDVQELVDTAFARFGRIDVLVANTGGPPLGPFEAHTPAVWRDTWRQLVESVLNLTRLVLPDMRTRRWGRIINITSIAAKQPVDNLVLSNAVRPAVTGFARTLANEVAADGITVNNVLPGYLRTSRLLAFIEPSAGTTGSGLPPVAERWVNETPMQRLGEPRELAAMVAFLASERASFITGQSVAVDGGWVRSLF